MILKSIMISHVERQPNLLYVTTLCICICAEYVSMLQCYAGPHNITRLTEYAQNKLL